MCNGKATCKAEGIGTGQEDSVGISGAYLLIHLNICCYMLNSVLRAQNITTHGATV